MRREVGGRERVIIEIYKEVGKGWGGFQNIKDTPGIVVIMQG